MKPNELIESEEKKKSKNEDEISVNAMKELL
jgi:hypothetical protein